MLSAMLSAVVSSLTSVSLTSVLVFLLVFFLAWGYLHSRPPPDLPPGPSGLPVVGSLFSLWSDTLVKLHKWRKQYGDVFSLRLGNRYMIVINSYKLAHEAFVKHSDVFSGRPTDLYAVQQIIGRSGVGVIIADGPVWKALRRVTLTTLRNLGVGKRTLEERVREEARVVLHELGKGQGQGQGQGHPVLIKPLANKFSSNVICSVVFGQRMEYDDPVFTELMKQVNDSVSVNLVLLPSNFISLAKFLPSMKKTLRMMMRILDSLEVHIDKLLQEHENSYDEDNLRDFVDLYIKTRDESGDKHLFNASNMRRVIIDLFVAGTETSSTVMDWAVLHLIDNPEVQAKCQQCIDQVLGRERMVTSEDRKDLPYIEAVITEVLRISTIVPLGISHTATREGCVGGYKVPAGSMVMPNVMEMHLDPQHWPSPQEFRPERFLDKDGKFCPPREHFMPFSVGPRTCLGEMLARMEIFVLLTSLLQTFTFTLPQGQKPCLQGHMGIVFSAKPQPVIFTRR